MSLTKVSWSMLAGKAVTPEDFGCVGDGVTDDGPAMALACNYCSETGATLWMSPKVYHQARLEVHGTYIIHGNGATVMYLGVGQTLISGTGSGTLAVPTPWPTDPGYQPSYPPTTIYSLAVAPALGSTSLTLTSATGITVGMYLFLFGNPTDRSSATNYIPQDFEWVRVVEIAGNVITLAEPTKSSYLTTQSGLAYGEGNAVDCEISNLTINTTTDAYQYVVRSGVNCKLTNITLAGNNACGASTFCKNLVYENFVATSGSTGPDNARGSESVTWNNAAITLYSGTDGSYIEESFYDITFNNYKVYGGGFNAGNLGITSTQRPRKITYLNCFADAAIYGGAVSPFSLGVMSNIEISVNDCTFKGAVTTPNATNFPGITGQSLVWVSGNLSTDIVNFTNCRFISTNVGQTWPVAIGAFNGTVQFDPLCTYVTCSAPAQIVPYNETGTWTPAMTGVTSAGVTTHTTQTGNYIRVGNLVTVNFEVTWSAATGTGNMFVYGLPFIVGASNTAYTFIADGTLAIANGAAALPQSGQVRLLVAKAISGTGSLNGIISYIV